MCNDARAIVISSSFPPKSNNHAVFYSNINHFSFLLSNSQFISQHSPSNSHHPLSNSLFNHNNAPSTHCFFSNKQWNIYSWSIGLTNTQSRRNTLDLHALLTRFLFSLRSKTPTTHSHSALSLIPLFILTQRARVHRRRALRVLLPLQSYHSESIQKVLTLNGTNLPRIHLHQIIDLSNLQITRFSRTPPTGPIAASLHRLLISEPE